jgi:hypothetical protein
MSTDSRFERLLADALAHSAPEAAPVELIPDILAAASRARRRPRWLALATERPMRRHDDVLVGSPTLRRAYLVGLAMLLALLAVSAIVGSGIVRPPDLAVVVPPSPSPSASLPTSAPSPSAELQRQIAYSRIEVRENGQDGCVLRRPEDRCYRSQLWISSTDGTGAHQPFPEMVVAEPRAWTADGTRLLFDGWKGEGDGALYQTDLSIAAPQIFETGCTAPCIWDADIAFSPDGQRIVFLRGINRDPTQFDPTENVIATMDIATGRVHELESTRATSGFPRWSHDGTRIVFVAGENKFVAPSPNALFVVDADGSNLREIVPAGLGAEDPRWSPDGSRILFDTSSVNAGEDAPDDLYTVRPDGTDLRRLTSDGVSRGATWTADGRIVFVRVPLDAATDVSAVEVWSMDGDGGNLAQLDANDPAAMTAANCLSCAYPLTDLTTAILQGFELPNALWQPQP